MKLLLLSVLFSFGLVALHAETKGEPISAMFVNERPVFVLQCLERWGGKEVVASPQVLDSKIRITFKFEKVSKLHAVIITMEALRKAGIVVKGAEGKLVAELVAAPVLNKQSQ